MKTITTLMCCMLLFVFGCSDSTGPGDTGGGEIIAQVSIGARGGTAGSETVGIDVPAGSFPDDASIAISTSPEQAFDSDAVSDTYVISGLPQTYSKELTVSVAYTCELADSSYIAVGVDSWISSLGETQTSYMLLPASLDGGMLTAELPPIAGAIGKPAAPHEEVPVSATVTAVSGYKPHVTAGGHFRIEFASRWTTAASVQLLGEYLEEAYDTIADLGFSYAARTNWPVSVTVKNLGNEVYGFSSNSLWGDNYGYLEFNSQKMSELSEIRTTAGHEFLHLVQSLYDSRNFYSKAKFQPPQHWLSEAVAVWAEEKFSDEQDYVSAARQGNNMTPFAGVIAGAATDAGKHGYGLSAMIKYLVNEYGESCILDMYQEIRNGKSPLAAISAATEDPVVWWDAFLQQYTRGNFYNVSLGELTANKSGMYQVTFDSDTLATFTDDYHDLSGKLYVIRLENADFDENAIMNVSVTGDFSEISVFKYRINPRAVELVGTDNTSVSISGLRALEYDGWHLIALVSNVRNIPPYTQSTSLTTTVRVSAPNVPPFNYFTLHPELIGDFTSTIKDDYTTLFYPSFSPAGPGVLNGTVFVGTRSEAWSNSWIEGTYMITFDESFMNILSIQAAQTKITPGSGDNGDSYHNVTFFAENIPISYIDGDSYVYRLRGDEITNQVTQMSFEYGIEGDRHTELIGYRGGGGSDIMIRMTVF